MWLGAAMQLLNKLTGNRAFGFSLNQPLTDVQAVVDSVKKTVGGRCWVIPVQPSLTACGVCVPLSCLQAIYDIEDPSTDIVVAVAVYPYANQVCSVWLYVASLVPMVL